MDLIELQLVIRQFQPSGMIGFTVRRSFAEFLFPEELLIAVLAQISRGRTGMNDGIRKLPDALVSGNEGR